MAEFYAARAEQGSGLAEALAARSRLVSNLRGLSFGVLVVAALFALFGASPATPLVVAALALLVFVALVAAHGKVIEREDKARRWARVNRDAQARCDGRWHALPERGERHAAVEHLYADDLDLFGQGSLFQRICVAHTRFGQDALARMLTEPASASEVRRRQEAVRALAPALDTRQQLEALALAVVDAPRDAQRSAKEPPDPEPLLRWAEDQPRLLPRRAWVWAARLLPVLTVTAIGASFFVSAPFPLWAPPVLAQLWLVLATREETSRVFTAVSATEGAFVRYGAMLELIERLDEPAELLREMREKLLGKGAPPSVAMQEFRRAVGWFDLRHNGMVHPFANVLLCWDANSTIRLERWQVSSGRAARGWFESLGFIEALSSFAALAHDEPGFAFPELDEAPTVFEADALGHPLIDPEVRVTNDVSLPGASTALLVTGSNMSGKSTLLRSMGLALVLALAGAPVCARRLRTAPFVLRTSVRVRDSLEGGVSHFYAELKKLKAVLDATRGEAPVFFLLDEILHGTNSRERQIGARWLIAELLRRGAVGAVSTHDMELAVLPPDLAQRMSLVHFRESVHGSEMRFDYLLRPGPVTAGNALRLMRTVGLEVPLG